VAVTIDIGGIRVGLEGLDLDLTDAVRSRYQRFLSDAAPEFVLDVRIAGSDAHRPRDMPVIERRGDHAYAVDYGALTAELDFASGRGTATVLSTVYIVDSLLRITVTLLGLERNALLVHSSGVKIGERVLVCFGPSGVGKTTVARSVDRAQVLCDEMMLLTIDDGDVVRAHGTPFHGDLSYCAPGTGELVALTRLVQGETDALVQLSDGKAARALLNSVLFFCRDEALAERLLTLALRICVGRTYQLTFRRETHVPTFIDTTLRRDPAPPRAQASRT
jgi:hypothetical protein